MKKVIGLYILTCFLYITVAAQKTERSTSITRSSEKNETRMTIKDESGTFELRYAGDIAFTDDEKAIANISRNGYLYYRKNRESLKAKPVGGDLIEYEINGDKADMNSAEEKSFLTKVVRELIKRGMGAKDRAARLYKKGGVDAVLEEVEKMEGDFAHVVYLKTLVEDNKLSEDAMQQVLQKTDRLIQSDYEKSDLLKKVSATYLKNATTSKYWMKAVQGIKSDYEKANTLKVVMENELSDSQFTQVLSLIKTIGSDYEKANLLKEAFFQGINNSRFDEMLAVTETIDSDFEMANVMNKLIDKAKLSETQWVNLLQATGKISSDFEKANVLKRAAKKMPASETVKTAFMKAAKSIDSSFEYGEVMKAIK